MCVCVCVHVCALVFVGEEVVIALTFSDGGQ